VLAQVSDGTNDGEGLALTEVELASRYRLAERGDLPVDLLIYGEVGKRFGASVYDVEGRLVMGRELGALSAVANVIGGAVVGGDVDEAELALGWAAGVSYEVAPRWKLGVESWGGMRSEGSEEVAATAGPAVAWMPSTRLWVTATAGFGLTDEADAFTAAAIIGLGL
jgi:hypothetical protein